MRFRTILALAATTAVALLAIGAGVASAHTVRFDSEVTIEYSADPSTFFGTVSSPRVGCVPRRLVTLYEEAPGADTALGSDRTNQEGDWRIPEPLGDGGIFYARVARRDMGGPGHDHICKAAKSDGLAIF
jgi:hypothetical protein